MYLWLKAFHLIAVISWMAGMLYLPRLMAYHADAEPGSRQSETFKVMEQRLLRFIMLPALILTWVLGITLAVQGGWFESGWLHAKLALVIALTILHGFLKRQVRVFAQDANTRPARFYKMVNEVPTLLMIAIVILVVVKPL